MKRTWILAATALVLVLAGRAFGEPKVVVEGDAKVAKAVRAALDKDVELVDAGDAEAVAIVRVTVKKKGKKYRATVVATQLADDAELARYTVTARRSKLPKATAAKARAKLSKPLAAARGRLPDTTPVAETPPEPEPREVATAPAEVPRTSVEQPLDSGAVHASATPARERREWAWVEAAVEARPFLRTLRYNDDINQALRAYDLAAPAVGGSIVLRPAPKGALRFFALRAEAESAVGVNGSRTDTGMEYGTSATEWSGGVRGAFTIGGSILTIDAAYGEHRFVIEDESEDVGGMELVPDTTYRWVRGALGLRVPFGDKLSFDVGAGWRQLLGTGDLESEAWFPRSSGAGIDADLGLTYAVGGAVSAHVRGDLRRYFFAMNPEVGDPWIAGGAVDQYLAIVTGLAIELR